MVDAKTSRHKVSSLLELWACGTDEFGDGGERMEALRFGLGRG